MADRTLALPAQLLRRLFPSAGIGAFVTPIARAASRLWRRACEPALPRMSDEWLRSLDHDLRRRPDR